jgi:polyvinyl alcohol dehydrogenase (cytochrome)
VVGAITALVTALATTLAFCAGLASAQTWTSWGYDPDNSRTQPLESILNPGNVGELTQKWTHLTAGYVSATPTVAGGMVYFPDSAGYLYALDATTGARVWRTRISSYDGIANSVSRDSPVVWGNYLILGDRGDNAGADQSVSARVFEVNRLTGRLVWMTQVARQHAAQITGSPVVAKNTVIVGVSSNEEGDAELSNYPCCTFRGSVVALSAKTGAIRWTTYMVPPNDGPCTGHENGVGPVGCGYSGAAVWGSPAADTTTGQVFVGTGNDYTTPDSATACENAALSSGSSDADCTAADDYFDAVVAMKLSNGKVQWGHKVEGWDASNQACDTEPPGATWCPSITSPDYDFGDSPNVMQITGAKGKRETVVGIGQKSGVYWTLDAATGRIVWSSLVGPGSGLGGIVWGTAYDGRRIYVPLSNPYGTPYNLGGPGGPPASGGSWAALNPQTGAFDWQTATPGGAAAYGPASVANGVVYVGDMAPSGDNMFALDAATGKTLWSFAAAGSVNASPAIVDGTLYWGSGYGGFGLGWTGSHKFYAFGLPKPPLSGSLGRLRR